MMPLITSRRRLAAVAVAVLVGVAGCGDDDDTPSPPTPTGANEAPEGNVDVTSSIADPDVAASNIGAIDAEAPNDP